MYVVQLPENFQSLEHSYWFHDYIEISEGGKQKRNNAFVYIGPE